MLILNIAWFLIAQWSVKLYGMLLEWSCLFSRYAACIFIDHMCFMFSILFFNYYDISDNTLRHCFLVIRPTVCPPIKRILCATVSLCIVEEFQWNVPQIFIMWVGNVGKLFKVRVQGQGHDQTECCNSGGMHSDDLVSRLACFYNS